MGVGHCTAGSAERRCLKIIVPRFKPYTYMQEWDRSENGRASKRGRNKRYRERIARENKANKT